MLPAVTCRLSPVTCHLSPAVQEASGKLKHMGSRGRMATKLKLIEIVKKILLQLLELFNQSCNFDVLQD